MTSQPTIPATAFEDTLSYPTWVTDKLLRDYYDTEWGMAVTDERGLFEALSLEAFQVGLSWRTILARREAFRRAFELAATPRDASAEDVHLPLITHSSTPTNTDSVEAPNACRRRVRTLRDEDLDRMRERTLSDGTRVPGGLPAWLWSFAPHETIAPHTLDDIPTDTPESALLAKSFKTLGGVFLGPVTAYALMCAVGMVDAHLVGSHRRGCSGLFA